MATIKTNEVHAIFRLYTKTEKTVLDLHIIVKQIIKTEWIQKS